MICSQVTIEATGSPVPPAGATHVIELSVWKAFPWSKTGAEAVTNITNFLSGASVFGYQIDMSTFTGWDMLKAEWVDTDADHGKMFIWWKKTGSPTLVGIIYYILAIMLVIGLIVTAWNFKDIAAGVLASVDAAIRAGCIKQYIDAGKTPEEALKLCPEKSAPLDMGTIFLAGAAILGAAYILGGKK